MDATTADDQMRRWFDGPEPFLTNPEDVQKLHPDLRPYVEVTPKLGHSLRHPLHYQVMGVNWRMANDQYEYKVERVAAAKAEGDWHVYLMLHERPYRLTTLADLWDAKQITLPQLRELLADIWTDAEYPSQHGKRLLLRLFKAAGFITDNPMTSLDKAAEPPSWRVEDRLPEVATIYRGQPIGEKPGLSWTTDIDIGAWFARRYRDDSTGMLLQGTVSRDKVLAYFEDRGEHEVVVDPRYIKGIAMVYPMPEAKGRAQPGFPKITNLVAPDGTSVTISS